MLGPDEDMRVICLLNVLLLALPMVATGQEATDCDGPYNGKSLNNEKLQAVLGKHREGINDSSSVKTSTQKLNLCGAYLIEADLVEADLSDANLSGAVLYRANLTASFLRGADLTGANLNNAVLFIANLYGANLADANLSGVNLAGGSLFDADLSGADLTGADLTGVNLGNAVLSGASLSETDLTETQWNNSILSGTIYEPKDGKHPPPGRIAKAKGLSEISYYQPEALVSLRELFKDGGYRRQERQITYALHHVRTKRLLDNNQDDELPQGVGEGFPGQVEGAFNYVLFELTTKWGMEPSRALLAIFVFIVIFTLPYVYALRAPKNDGIWRFWSEQRARIDLGSDKPELLSMEGLDAIKIALYFSILSAFHVGWRDLNVGNWITRIQPREYTLRASGWARTVSGVQSLLSVYLLAIWALTYFGRPFE